MVQINQVVSLNFVSEEYPVFFALIQECANGRELKKEVKFDELDDTPNRIWKIEFNNDQFWVDQYRVILSDPSNGEGAQFYV